MNVLTARVKIITPTPPHIYIIHPLLSLPTTTGKCSPGLGFRVGSVWVPSYWWCRFGSGAARARNPIGRARESGGATDLTGVNVLPHPECRGVKVPSAAGTSRTYHLPLARLRARPLPSLPTTPPLAPQWTPSSSTPASAPVLSVAADAQVPPSPSLPRAPR